MPIKLPNVTHKTVEQLRTERYDQYKPLTKRLRDGIQSICLKHRTVYEGGLYEGMMARLQNFLQKRKPNQTAAEYYRQQYGIGPDYRPEYSRGSLILDKRQWVARDVVYVVPLTDHPKKPEGHDWAAIEVYTKWDKNAERPDFEVKMLPGTPAELKRRAKEEFDHIIDAFIHKVTEKVLDILVAHPEYECELLGGKVVGSSFEGDVILKFGDKTRFRMHVSLKYNQSVLGTPYVQYPLTFHDVVTEANAKGTGMVSENKILEVMGIEPWKPTKSKKPWDKVAVGDIVELQDGTIVIVVKTRGDRAYFFRQAWGQREGKAEDIKFVHAHTKVRDEMDYTMRGKEVAWHESRQFVLYVEMFNGRTDKFAVDKKYNNEIKDESFQKQEYKVRLLGFPLIDACWDKLTAPFEPKAKKKIRRYR